MRAATGTARTVGTAEGGQGQEQMTALGRKRQRAMSDCGGAGREERAGKSFTVINLSLSVPTASERRDHGRGPETRGLQEVQ